VQVHAPDLIKEYQKQHHLSIKTLQAMIKARCALSPEQSQPSRNHYLPAPLLLNPLSSSSNQSYNPNNSSSCGSTTNPPTTPWSTPGSVKIILAPTIIPTDPRKCQPLPLTLWSRHPLTRRPPFSPPRLLCDPSPLALPKLWWSSTKTTPSPSSTLPRASPPPFERGNNKAPWLPWPSTTKYLISRGDWTIIETLSRSQQVTGPKGMLSTTKQEYQTLSYQPGMGTTNRHIGSSSWPKGKWQGSLGSTFWGKPHLLLKCTLLWLQDKRTSWGPSTPCWGGSGHCLQGPSLIMAHCSSTSKSLTTGEWSEKSSDSDSSSIIYRTSASESPITRPNSREYHRLRPQRRDTWSSPTSTIMRQISVSSVAPSLEGEQGPTSVITNSGAAWSPSR
jgi:hypothetical protein